MCPQKCKARWRFGGGFSHLGELKKWLLRNQQWADGSSEATSSWCWVLLGAGSSMGRASLSFGCSFGGDERICST